MGGAVQEVKSKLDDMVEGYLAGFKSGSYELPDCHKNKSAAFRHGWLNGRDDGMHHPRERAQVLKARANMILGE